MPDMPPDEKRTGSDSVQFFTVPLYAPRKVEFPPLKLSPHSVVTFRECKQHYKFYYIDKLRDQYFRAKPYFTMGNHVHATLREFLSRTPIELRTPKTIKELLRRNWRQCRIGFKNKEDEKRWAQKALAQLERFVEEQDVAVQPLMVETSLEAQITPQVILRGRVDRVDTEADGSLHIIDYKTGNMPEEMDWSQLHLYALILTRKLPYQVSKASFHYLSAGAVQTAEILPEVIEQTAWDLLVTAKDISTEKSFQPTPGAACKRCDFRPICPAKQPGYTEEMDADFELWRDCLNNDDSDTVGGDS